MLNVIITLAAITVTIVVLIGFHELGHLVAAKRAGVAVYRFAIGFGKPILRYKSNSGIEYVLGCIPFGGYVKLIDERESKLPNYLLHLSFTRQSFFKRAMVLLAGPLFNFIFALFAFWLAFIIGVQSVTPIIKNITTASPFAAAGVKHNEQIITIDGWEIRNWRHVANRLSIRLGDKNSLDLQTKNLDTGQIKQYQVDLSSWRLDPLKPDLFKSIGIEPQKYGTQLSQQQQFEVYSFLDAGKAAVKEIYLFCSLNLVLLAKLIIGKLSAENFAGPITFFKAIAASSEQGPMMFLFFLAVISLAIGLFNLLPIPGLDGGHLLYLAIERIRAKPLSLAFQVLMYRCAMIVLWILVVRAVSNDILRLLV